MAVTLGPDYDVWIQELDRGTLTRLTFGEGNDSLPIWTPDGERVTFSSSSSGPWNIFSVPADGSGEPVQLTSSENLSTASSWSPDGKILAFTHVGQETGVDIGILTMDDEPKTEVFLGTPFNEYHPMFSPDGRWLAYTSDESGRAEVYVRAFPGPGGKWQVSTDGGVYPLWAPSGRELFYRSGDKMMVVPISTAPELRPGTPVVLFEEPYHKLGLAVNNYHSYDVKPRRPTKVRHDQASRGRVRPNATERRPELVRRAETPCPHKLGKPSGNLTDHRPNAPKRHR